MPDVNALLAVQRLDTAADQLNHRRSHLATRAALGALRAELAEVRATMAALDERTAAIDAEQQGLEADVEVIEVKRASLARKLASTSVPREAAALTAELLSLQAHQNTFEERLLELMEEAEPVPPRRAALVERESDLAERAIVAQAELAAAEATIAGDLDAVHLRRVDAVATVPEALLQRYDKLRARLGGVAVAELEGNHCTGCNLALSTSEVERLHHLGPEVLAECENCGRILAR